MESSTAASEAFNPFDAASTHNLWALSAELRHHQPVARLASGVVYVSRYGDARQVLRQPEVFSSQGGFKAEGVEVPLGDASLGDFDEPEHGPARRLAMAAAGPSRVEGERAFAASSARRLVDRMAAEGGTSDVVASLALPLSSEVVAHLLGAPVDEAGRLFGWAEDIMHSELPVYMRTSRGVGYHGAFPEYAAFVDGLIDDRLAPGSGHDDAISRIVEGMGAEHGGADPAYARAMTFMITSTLLLGGVTTTRDLIGWLLYELVRKPDLYRAVGSDRALVPRAVEEVLRLYPPLLYLMRRCTADTEINGFAVGEGERVLVGLASANRDEDVYPSAEEFRLDRSNPAPHLTFGHGIHLCVGAALARMESEVLLEAFLDAFAPEDVRVTPGFGLELMPAPFMYGPVRVDVSVAPAR
jgi:cytochrome P450